MKAQQVSWEESDWLCPLHNAAELPHMPLTQVACALSLYLLAGPVGPLRGYGNSPRSTGLREATGHLLIHSRDEWISGEPSQLPQALSACSPDRWEPAGEASCYSPRGLAPACCSPRARRQQSGHKRCKRGKQAFKNTRTRSGTLLRLSNTKRAALAGSWFTAAKLLVAKHFIFV